MKTNDKLKASTIAQEFMDRINKEKLDSMQIRAIGGAITCSAINTTHDQDAAIELAKIIRDFIPTAGAVRKATCREKITRALDSLGRVLRKEGFADKEIMPFYACAIAIFLEVKFETPVSVHDVLEHLNKFTGNLLLKGMDEKKMPQA